MKTNFFKSASFKSIIVLIVIAVVLGGMLALLNDLLYVSPEDEVNRAIKKIYGKEVEWENYELNSEYSQNENYGQINTLYLLEDGNYLIQATGKGGYPNGTGTVTLWIVLRFEGGAFDGIEKVSYQSNDSQTLMSNFDNSFYNYYTENFDGDFFNTSDHYYAGATYTSTAINNSVNMAIYYAQNVLGGTADEN